MFKLKNSTITFLLSYILPVIFFGKFNNNWSYLIFISTIGLLTFFLMENPIKNKIQYYITCMILSFSLPYFDIHAFNYYTNKQMIGATFTLRNLIYWISMIICGLSYLFYKTEVVEEFEREFNHDEKRMERENKINKIMNKW